MHHITSMYVEIVCFFSAENTLLVPAQDSCMVTGEAQYLYIHKTMPLLCFQILLTSYSHNAHTLFRSIPWVFPHLTLSSKARHISSIFSDTGGILVSVKMSFSVECICNVLGKSCLLIQDILALQLFFYPIYFIMLWVVELLLAR